MNDEMQSENKALWDERSKILRPEWFGRLFGAKLGLGDTFWAGHFGIQLLLVPIGVFGFGIASMSAPSVASGGDAAAVDTVMWLFLVLQAGIALLVTQAVLRVGMRARNAQSEDKNSRGWRWAAMVCSVLYSFTAAYYVVSFGGM